MGNKTLKSQSEKTATRPQKEWARGNNPPNSGWSGTSSIIHPWFSKQPDHYGRLTESSRRTLRRETLQGHPIPTRKGQQEHAGTKAMALSKPFFSGEHSRGEQAMRMVDQHCGMRIELELSNLARALSINQRCDGSEGFSIVDQKKGIGVHWGVLQRYGTFLVVWLSETAPNTSKYIQYTLFLVGFLEGSINLQERIVIYYYHLGYRIFFDRDCMNKLLAFSLEFGSASISKNRLVRKEQHQFPPPCRKDG